MRAVHAEDPEMVSLATLTAGLEDEKKEPKARCSSISSYTGFFKATVTPESLPLYVQYVDTGMRTYVQKYYEILSYVQNYIHTCERT